MQKQMKNHSGANKTIPKTRGTNREQKNNYSSYQIIMEEKAYKEAKILNDFF